jgi:hypothetical protein
VDNKYKNIGTPDVRFIEECSEVIQAISKVLRFGLFNCHPKDKEKRTNAMQLLDEISDLEKTMHEFKIFLSNEVVIQTKKPLR